MNEETHRIISAEFETSVHDVTKQQLKRDLPEIAVVGRSNVGKSSLINALCQQKSLARTSKTPGRTNALNYFSVEIAAYQDKERINTASAYLVDLPGYGYAEVSKAERKRWDRLVQEYFYSYENLRAVLLLLDSRREIRDEELWFLGLDLDVVVALTKSDKISKQQLAAKSAAVAKELGLSRDSLYPVSVLSKKKTGLEVLTAKLFEFAE